MRNLLFSAILCLGGAALYAQPAQGNPGGNPAPIDGGISLLLAAGAIYGGKKAYDAYKSK